MKKFQVTGFHATGSKVDTLPANNSSEAISKFERLYGSGFHKINAKEDRP